MLRLPLALLLLALIAGCFGFGVIADSSWIGARVLFVVFLSLAVLSFLRSWLSRKSFSG